MAAAGDSLDQQVLVSLDDIEAAAVRVRSTVVRTPLLRSQSPGLPDLWLKCENLQLTGSFKIRGATNAVAQLSAEERAAGVVAHSSGNHAQALARAASAAGTTATIVMPDDSAVVKQRATRALGAEVVLVQAAERLERAEQIHRRTGAAFIAPFEDARVIAGQGTIGLEIVEQLPSVGLVLVPVSGGGLIAGVAAALKARSSGIRVIGVEPALAGDLAEGMAVGARVQWDVADTNRTIADGLRVPAVGRLPWEHIRVLVDDVLTVSEDEIRSAVRDLALREHLVVEPSGAVTYAAARQLAAAGNRSIDGRHPLRGQRRPRRVRRHHPVDATGRGGYGAGPMRSFGLYSLARLGLFLVSFGVVWAVANIWLDWNATNALGAAVIALLVSALASYVLLRGLRDRTALEVATRADRMRDAFARSRRDLDDGPEPPRSWYDDQRRRHRATTRPTASAVRRSARRGRCRGAPAPGRRRRHRVRPRPTRAR